MMLSIKWDFVINHCEAAAHSVCYGEIGFKPKRIMYPVRSKSDFVAQHICATNLGTHLTKSVVWNSAAILNFNISYNNKELH